MKKIGIIGGTGYTGGELARLLCVHPEMEIVSMTSRQSAGQKVSDVQTNLKGYLDIEFSETVSSDVDLVFVATPHGVAMSETPSLLDSGVKVIDMSGDYRLHDPSVYEKWYGHKHTDLKNLKDSVYGLPELFRDEIKTSNIVANPGCYATASILAIAPLFKAGLVRDDVIIDAKSGTSGAGMSPSSRTHHPYCGESIIPYGVGTHRHTPEMESAVGLSTGIVPNILFTPHLLPIVRGILSVCYTELKDDIDAKKVAEAYAMYDKERFVHLADEPSIRSVVGSNHAQVGAKVFGKRVVSICTIDNLVKGASGQAVQCANLMLNINETAGLDFPGLEV